MSISQSTDNQGTFAQGTSNSLFLRLTSLDSRPVEASSVKVSIVDPESNTVVDLDGAITVATGYYAYVWSIPRTSPPGQYSLTWSYDDGYGEKTITQNIVVSERPDMESIYFGQIRDLIVALEYHIRPTMNIPVYFEQGRPSKDNTTFRFTFPRWNQSAGVRIYRNQQVVEDGFTADYFRGSVTFDVPMSSYDIVNADYNFRWFSDDQLYRFLSNALAKFNFYPPRSHHSLVSVSLDAIPAVLYGAAADAIREIMLSLSFQEPQLVFGGAEKASNMASSLDTLKKNYEESVKGFLEAKKLGPYPKTRAIVVPEYTLPGGRSRWFRYIFSGGGS
jgi:hypothetical protein